MRVRGSLADSYPAAVTLVVCALVPFLMIAAAVLPLAPLISHSLGLSKGAFDLTIAMSDAAYAFGTVMAVQLASHLPPRRLLIVYVGTFVVAAVLAAWAPNKWVFVGALILEGLCTSLMLIAAVPALVTGWPAKKMPWTGAVMNLCIFGAVAVGPSIGGLEATAGHWRPLFWGVAGVAVLALVFAVLTYEDHPPQDRSAPWDVVAIVFASVGCAAAFFGAGELQAYRHPSPQAIVPLLAGVAMVVALVVHQYRMRHPLMPVKQLATTFPVAGILVALCASAASFGLMELVISALQKRSTPGHTALLFLPEFGGAVLTAGVFGVLFRTRFIPVLALCGTALIAVAGGVLSGMAGGADVVVAVGAALIGVGVGASVSPALFLAGLSLRSAQIQRVFALIELLRGVTAFLVAPILAYLAVSLAATSAVGTRDGILVCLGIAGVGVIGAGAVLLLGRGRLQVPDLEHWQKGEPAWESRPLLDGSRRAPLREERLASGRRGEDGETPGRERESEERERRSA